MGPVCACVYVNPEVVFSNPFLSQNIVCRLGSEQRISLRSLGIYQTWLVSSFLRLTFLLMFNAVNTQMD